MSAQITEGTAAEIMMLHEPPKQFGPEYNVDSAKLKTFRAKARKGLMKLSRAERLAYAEAVEAAVKAKVAITQPNPKASCASGTWHTDGNDIAKAVRAQNRARQNAAALKDRSDRTPEQWREMYDAAMRAKKPMDLGGDHMTANFREALWIAAMAAAISTVVVPGFAIVGLVWIGAIVLP